jgi:hypothetical protein
MFLAADVAVLTGELSDDVILSGQIRRRGLGELRVLAPTNDINDVSLSPGQHRCAFGVVGIRLQAGA